MFWEEEEPGGNVAAVFHMEAGAGMGWNSLGPEDGGWRVG